MGKKVKTDTSNQANIATIVSLVISVITLIFGIGFYFGYLNRTLVDIEGRIAKLESKDIPNKPEKRSHPLNPLDIIKMGNIQTPFVVARLDSAFVSQFDSDQNKENFIKSSPAGIEIQMSEKNRPGISICKSFHVSFYAGHYSGVPGIPYVYLDFVNEDGTIAYTEKFSINHQIPKTNMDMNYTQLNQLYKYELNVQSPSSRLGDIRLKATPGSQAVYIRDFQVQCTKR